ncbi:MAG: SRPBCC family protein [Deltaproteobacteria bacterium]|nr:SRPBCC family protein [Deltaproteobacteria bacterium]MBW2414960.1 SRPBCC family protein [Deltaproteobacteria bacterium]
MSMGAFTAIGMWLVLAASGAAPMPDVGAPSPCIACAVPVARLEDLVSSSELDQLREGQILVAEDERKSGEASANGKTRAAALVRRAPDAVWSTLTDFESWPGFMPLIDSTEIARREGDQVWVRQRFSVMFVGMGHTSVYDLAPRAGEIRWALDDEEPADIVSSTGTWRLVPVDGGKATLVRYRASMSSGRAVPEFVQDMLMKRSLRALLGNLRTEVERRYVVLDRAESPAERASEERASAERAGE